MASDYQGRTVSRENRTCALYKLSEYGISATMRTFCYIVTLSFALLSPPSWAGGKLYRWVDENGVTHYGDRVPPQYAKKEHDVLNDHGIKIGTVSAAPTAEELAEAARLEERRKELAKRARRDRILLATYLSVEEIELLRDRRIELLQAQSTVTAQYLDTLREKMLKLENESASFKPFSQNESAPPIPDSLAKERIITLNAINEYERSLSRLRANQVELEMEFAEDIDRFKRLKTLN